MKPKRLRQMVNTWLRQKLMAMLDKRGYDLVRQLLARPLFHPRYDYQRRFVDFDVREGSRVLDIGCGGDPFPHATVLVDCVLQQTKHRHEALRRDARHFVVADIGCLPFKEKCFEFVYCSHLLEHVDEPIKACKEIIRVAIRGYIETPTFGKDALFTWAKGQHKWHVVSIGNVLCFFEYTARQLEGIRSSACRDIVLSKWYRPLQKAFYENQDIFNVMFVWEEVFAVFVFHLDGSVQTLNVERISQAEFSKSNEEMIFQVYSHGE